MALQAKLRRCGQLWPIRNPQEVASGTNGRLPCRCECVQCNVQGCGHDGEATGHVVVNGPACGGIPPYDVKEVSRRRVQGFDARAGALIFNLQPGFVGSGSDVFLACRRRAESGR